MIKEKKVSLWLGCFESREDFDEYIEASYDEDGDCTPSAFQKNFEMGKYDEDAIESDYMEERCSDIETLLKGFSGDDEIIPQFKEMLNGKPIEKYNSIILLYHFEYEKQHDKDSNMEYIGCANVNV